MLAVDAKKPIRHHDRSIMLGHEYQSVILRRPRASTLELMRTQSGFVSRNALVLRIGRTFTFGKHVGVERQGAIAPPKPEADHGRLGYKAWHLALYVSAGRRVILHSRV